MTVGELMCLNSSVKSMLAKLDNPNVDNESKQTYIKNELTAMKKLIESHIK